MAEWKLVFQPKMEDVAKLDAFLKAKLHKEYQLRIGHGGRVIVENLMGKNDGWKVGEWVRNQSPIGKNLRYMIAGYEETATIYLSYCPLCRKGASGPHHEHAKAGT